MADNIDAKLARAFADISAQFEMLGKRMDGQHYVTEQILHRLTKIESLLQELAQKS